MKPRALFIALAFIATGCADPLERRSTDEVGAQVQRGITGQGRLVPREPINNPTAPSAAETPPDYPQ